MQKSLHHGTITGFICIPALTQGLPSGGKEVRERRERKKKVRRDDY